eukprot:Awhi_evm1s3284
MYSLDVLKVPFHLGGISRVDVIARKKATISKMMNCLEYLNNEKQFELPLSNVQLYFNGRPIDFVRYGSETLYYHGEEQSSIGKDKTLTHTEAFLHNLIEHHRKYKLKLWKGFSDQCFDAVAFLKNFKIGFKRSSSQRSIDDSQTSILQRNVSKIPTLPFHDKVSQLERKKE